ncbi:hypothetical protein Tco_0307426 [Tanacetum coccineum]
MTSPNKPTSKPSRVAKMSVKPIWRKKPNLCNTSNVLNTTSPIPKPLTPHHEPSQENNHPNQALPNPYIKDTPTSPQGVSHPPLPNSHIAQAPPQSNNQTQHTPPLSLRTMAGAPGVVKPEIRGNVNFEIKSQFMRELREDTFFGNKNEDAHDHIDRVLNIGPILGMTPNQALTAIQTMADHSQKWHDGTSSRNISSSSNTDGLAIIVRPHIDKECPLNEEVKPVEEVKYGEFGRPAPFNGSNRAKFSVGPPGYYTRTDN